MKKPILFNTEMVKAILEGRKTVTRRVINLDLGLADTDKNDNSYLKIADEYGDYWDVKDLCRYKIGDILYVRETYGFLSCWDCEIGYCDKDNVKTEEIGCFVYKADLSIPYNEKWKPSIHMPKEVARIFLKVTDVRVEKLQDIINEECLKEGVNTIIDFDNFWDSTIKKADMDKYGWDSNPYVWVVEFEKLRP